MSNRTRNIHKSQQDPLMDVSDDELMSFLFNSNNLTTPPRIDINTRNFCTKISPHQTPVFLTVKAPNWSRLNYCNKNVERMIELNGGEMVLGYKIWYISKLYIEAERHAIWKNIDGELVDITFNINGENTILFLPAPTMKTIIVQAYKKPREVFHPRLQNIIKLQIRNETIQSQYFSYHFDNSWAGWEKAMSYETWCSNNHKT